MSCSRNLIKYLTSLDVKTDSVEEYLEWVKQLVTISSAAIGFLFYKFDKVDMLTSNVKFSAASFVLSIVMFMIFFPALVEHKYSKQKEASKKAYFSLFLGWVGFDLGFGFLAMHFLNINLI